MNKFPMVKNLSDNGVNFDQDHYMTIYNLRKNKGEDLKHSFEVTEMEDFQVAENTPIYDKVKERYVYIQSVHKQWHRGWYYTIVYYNFYKKYNGELDKSHGTMYIRNISCHNDIILESIKENSQRYILNKK